MIKGYKLYVNCKQWTLKDIFGHCQGFVKVHIYSRMCVYKVLYDNEILTIIYFANIEELFGTYANKNTESGQFT